MSHSNFSPQALALSQQLSQKIQATIQQQGLISFQTYMNMVLYDHQFGYYSNGHYKLGELGDFMTAPELSSLFSRCIAIQMAQVCSKLSKPDILELGAGSGKMAKDILLQLQQAQQLPQQYLILEPSRFLQDCQKKLLQQALPDYYDHIIWLNRLPKNFRGMMIANEVLDALPVQLFCYQNQRLYEVMVAYDESEQQFAYDYQAADAKLSQFVQQWQSQQPFLAEGYQSEAHTLIPAWLNSLANCLEQGGILLIDYGYLAHEYYHPQRYMGSLICHSQHQANDKPFFLPGLQDISSFVNFSLVIEVGKQAGLDCVGYDSQANFLLNCGITELLANYDPNDVVNYLILSHQVKKLILPSEMGEKFKVVGFAKGIELDWLGFQD